MKGQMSIGNQTQYDATANASLRENKGVAV